jgi:hypothetical protein
MALLINSIASIATCANRNVRTRRSRRVRTVTSSISAGRTECVGYFDKSQCAGRPVDRIVPDPDHRESKDQLQE